MVIQKTAENSGHSVANKIQNRNTKVAKSSPQNNSETITNEYVKEIPKEKFISPVEREKIIDDLRLI